MLSNFYWMHKPNPLASFNITLLVVQIFRVPLIFTIGGSINIGKSGNWFTAQLTSTKKTKRKISRLRRMHLIGWSFIRLFEWGFLRNGTHELCIIKPPIRSRTLNKIQERNEEVILTWRTDDIIEKASLTIQLRDARFLDFVEEKKLEQQPNYDQPQSDQLDKTNESIDLNEQMKKLDDINLHAMVKYRAENDVNWLEKDKDGADQLLTEIHELLKTEVVSEKCKILSL
ncbi:unnamed protein product [Heterobilharzia americana]|nr:unnamed protein product [Heterobilharzia americana]